MGIRNDRVYSRRFLKRLSLLRDPMTYSAVRRRAWHVSHPWLLVLSPAAFRDVSAFLTPFASMRDA